MRAFILALMLASTQAHAIGDTERGILYGVGISWLWNELTQPQAWKPGGGSSYPLDREFPPFRCTGDSIKCSYEKGVYDREYAEWLDRKNKAYECGRYGRNCEQD